VLLDYANALKTQIDLAAEAKCKCGVQEGRYKGKCGSDGKSKGDSGNGQH
jgi:hypothetical protein